MPESAPVPAVAAYLIELGAIASLGLWLVIGWRVSRGRTVCPFVPRASTPIPFRAFWTAVCWTVFVLLTRVLASASGERPAAQASDVWFNLLLSAGVFGMLVLLLFGDRRYTPIDAGLRANRWTIPLGLGIFVASIAPTLIALLLLTPVRSPKTQHQLLQFLGESPDGLALAGLAVTVVVVAPLAEELLFRVVLQGWLAERYGGEVAVRVIAVVFAAVHGWRDGLALLPFALLLGYVYDRRHDFFAVVVAHGAFNAANLLLAMWNRPA